MSSSQRLLSLTHYLPYTCTIKGLYPHCTTTPTAPHQIFQFLGDENSFANNGIPSPLTPAETTSPTCTPTKNPEWSFGTRRGHSALFAGIRSLESANSEHVIHIGYIGDVFDEAGNFIELESLAPDYIQALKTQLLEEKSCVPILLTEANAVGHYEGYCKNDLWPLFHYILWDTATDGRMEKNNWDHYVAVNNKYAEVVAEMHQPRDLVWIHDYHLLLAPSMIRAAVPSALIAFFLHAPFPSSEIFRCLPKRQEVLEGVLGANLIGFQTYSYARHFISSCTRVLGLESTPKGVESYQGLVAVGIFPIGIDVEHVERTRKNLIVKEKIAAIREMYAGKKIIIGRDKLDQIKGVHQKLLAFEKFLQEYPEWRGRVVLIQVTSPPQRDSPKLEAKVSELVSRINGTYGSLEFAPVHHYHQHIDRDEYSALLSVADIGLITSVRDGMNTTSHEFVVCQQENQGPLILSEFTGTAGSLSSAIQVNPWDYLSVAEAIEEALTMTAEEKEAKHQQLFSHVTQFTAQYWAQSFVKEARNSLNLADKSNTTPYLDIDLMSEKYKNAKHRLLMFDYDGTLTPIRKLPKAAVPPKNMLAAISRLTQDSKNVVFVISGRDQPALDEWLGHISNLGLSAEHGCFIKYPAASQDDESNKWINLSESIDLGWKNDVVEIFTYYTERTQGSFIEHKRCSLTWHYRLADPEYGHFQAKECQNHLENAVLSKLPVEILVGKKNLEVRPVSINKGEIVKRLLTKHAEADFVFCAGDDKTDEDMFKVLRHCTSLSSPTSSNGSEQPSPRENGVNGSGSESPGVFTCTIGSSTKMTLASWHVQTPEDLIGAMEVMADLSRN